MRKKFSFSDFTKQFPTDDACLEEIKKLRFYKGIYCDICKKTTNHYKISYRTAYSCEFCRHQVYPLAGTIFEKTTTPLRLWFYAMFLMTHTRASISITQLQKELGVTYKTAWAMHTTMKNLMEQHNNNLLIGDIEIDNQPSDEPEKGKVYTWAFFNKLVITIREGQSVSGNNNEEK